MSDVIKMSDANKITRDYLDRILVEERLLDADEPDLTMELFGSSFCTPVMMPAFSHLNCYHGRPEDGLIEYAKAMKALNGVNCVGMMENDRFADILAVGAKTIRIVKPYKDRSKVLDQIRFAAENGAFAVGIDIDHTFGSDGRYDLVVGENMVRQTAEDIRELVNAAGIPFIVKGVLSVQDAVKCMECGAAAIIVSHHHGRMPFAIPPLMVLPDIVRAVGDRMKIFVDCSIDTGADAFKALALGADAVCVGRAMMPDLENSGTEGMLRFMKRVNDELSMMMAFTGAKKLSEIGASVLWDRETGKRLL